MNERRRERRNPIELSIRLKVGKKALFGTTHDVSFKGLSVKLDDDLPTRQLVQIELELPAGDPLRGHAMVIHCGDGRLGVEFFGSGMGSDWDGFVSTLGRTSGAPPPPQPAGAGPAGSLPPPMGHAPSASMPPPRAGGTSPIASIPPLPMATPPAGAPLGGQTGPRTGPRGVERRRAPRIPLRLELRLRSPRNIHTAFTTDVSMLSVGILLQAADLASGEVVIVNLIQPGTSFSFRRDGTVQRVSPVQDGWVHLGIEFTPLEPMREVLFADFMNTAFASLNR